MNLKLTLDGKTYHSKLDASGEASFDLLIGSARACLHVETLDEGRVSVELQQWHADDTATSVGKFEVDHA